MNKSIQDKKLIIILDDEEAIRENLEFFIKHHLGEQNIEIISIGNADHALKVIDNYKGSVDLISTDTGHPGIDGLSFSEDVKKAYPDIKIIICTAYAPKEKKERAEKVADFFFLKPFEIEDYIKAVKFCLNIL